MSTDDQGQGEGEASIDTPSPERNVPLENALVGLGIDVDTLRVSPTGGAAIIYHSAADDYDLPAVLRVLSEVVDLVDGPFIATVAHPETGETRGEYAVKAGWVRQYIGGQIGSQELVERILSLDHDEIESLYERAFEGTGIAFYNQLDRRLRSFGCLLTELEQETEDLSRMHARVTPQALQTEAVTNRGPIGACLPVIIHYFAEMGVKFRFTFDVVVEHVDGSEVDRVRLPGDEVYAYHEAMHDEDADDEWAFLRAFGAAVETADTVSSAHFETYRDRVENTSTEGGQPAELEPLRDSAGRAE